MFHLMDSQIWWLLAGVGGVLVISSFITEVLARTLRGEEHHSLISNLRARVYAWWIMVGVIAVVLIIGESAVILLFWLLSVLALREFFTISTAEDRSRSTLIWCFGIIPAVHYFCLWQHWYGLFSILIPTYAFLFLPARSALTGRTEGFMQRAAIIQWSLMTAVYAMSHAPALLQLPVAIEGGRALAEGSAPDSGGPAGAKLLLFLIIVVQGSDVLQYVWGKSLGRHKIVPRVSPNKTWEGFLGGIATASALGAALWWLTPFTPWQAAALAFVSCLLGFAGGLVMSAIKRDRGIKDFGTLLPGHGGIMDRTDSLVFAAPVFFHLVRFFFTA